MARTAQEGGLASEDKSNLEAGVYRVRVPTKAVHQGGLEPQSIGAHEESRLPSAPLLEPGFEPGLPVSRIRLVLQLALISGESEI